MKQNQQFLSSLLKTIQTGQVEIRSVMDTCLGSGLRNTLQGHLREYDSMETEVYSAALQRGWELPELDPAKRFLKDRLIRMQLNGKSTDSRIADILIRGNTKSMIHGLRNLHQYDGQDHQIRVLSQKLLDCETAHIQQMQHYL